MPPNVEHKCVYLLYFFCC